jgi:glycosyltransferase involved in cell wall biosynthesis
MKIIQFNTLDNISGAAKVAYRLMERLKSKGHTCKMYVKIKTRNCKDVVPLLADPVSSKEVVSSHLLHFHNLHGDYFNLSTLALLSKMKPCVWTLHDMHAFTGHCAHSFDCNRWRYGCGDCPDLSIYPPLSKDTTSRLWEEKRKLYAMVDLTLVAPSLWLKRKISESMLREKRIELIPNGVDTEVFRPYPRDIWRERLGLPKDAIVLAFSAYEGMDNMWRDGRCLAEMIRHLSQKDKSIFFLNIGGETNRLGAPNTINIPYISDEIRLASIYSCADLFVYPSLADNCPLVVMEAMACGLPVVAYRTGGVPEIVKDGVNGIIVGYRKTTEFIRAVEQLVYDPETLNYYRDEARGWIQRRFSLEGMVERYIRIYEGLIS